MDTTKIEEFLNKAAETGTFLIDQAPNYVKQYLQLQLFTAVFYLIIGLFLASIPLIIKKLLKEVKKEQYFSMNFLGKEVNDGFAIPAWIVTCILWLVSTIMICCSLYDIIAISFFPEAWLISKFL
jgi:hypothetical protein